MWLWSPIMAVVLRIPVFLELTGVSLIGIFILWKSSWVLASSHSDFVVHSGDWQLCKPGLMSDRHLHLSAKCWIWTCIELCKPQWADFSQAPQSLLDSLSFCSYLSPGWHFLHHFFFFFYRRHWSVVENPGSVSSLDLNGLCFLSSFLPCFLYVSYTTVSKLWFKKNFFFIPYLSCIDSLVKCPSTVK